jgi:hypothetical protein
MRRQQFIGGPCAPRFSPVISPPTARPAEPAEYPSVFEAVEGHCYYREIRPHAAFLLRLAVQQLFGRREFTAIILAWEQMPVGVGRHGDTGMAEPLLHHFQR